MPTTPTTSPPNWSVVNRLQQEVDLLEQVVDARCRVAVGIGRAGVHRCQADVAALLWERTRLQEEERGLRLLASEHYAVDITVGDHPCSRST